MTEYYWSGMSAEQVDMKLSRCGQFTQLLSH